ncbi:type VII secretion target [Micromonospora peucetia]|uniref:Excreted virulence factor EspC, type VII ESX diderm n=1 Tax=Micromonospora peucetia TaxID=47871 RepID=A0A1C6VAH5_9ACTN|nr:type VII secretion target [Micromonospora peucetia]MCX4389480.1 type VII secretion target [Micromonospora peucetia]WSA29970.1 type VII secretion target [Micromonospora peucetia]SCL63265.1 Excreted virulence factor EspC, type VII ESX diderm [Micromonospora peucetia]
MAEEPLTVRPEVLRRAASGLDDDAYRLGHGFAGASGLVVVAPEWSAGAALTGLESAVHAWAGGLGARVAGTAGAVRAAAGAYEAVDDRAAGRMGTVPR